MVKRTFILGPRGRVLLWEYQGALLRAFFNFQRAKMGESSAGAKTTAGRAITAAARGAGGTNPAVILKSTDGGRCTVFPAPRLMDGFLS